MDKQTLILTVLIVVVAILVVIVWYFYVKAIQINAYYWVNKWNDYISNQRDEQNKVSEPGLPPSMQYARSAHLKAAQKLDALISAQHDQILKEVMELIRKGYYGLPMSEIDFQQGETFKTQQGWRPIWVKFIDQWAGTAKQLPTLRKIVTQMGSDILLLHVSVFWPPVQLQSHRGISKGAYRYHYGLSIPEGDTGMKIAGVPFKWAEREGVIWDDTLEHTSWNLTHQPRFIIFADLPRELGWGTNWLNRQVHTFVQRTKHVKVIQEKLAQEGIRID